MHIKNRTVSRWNELLLNKKDSLSLSELDFSALSSWILDIEQSYRIIYVELLEKIENADTKDKDLLHDCVADIYFNLKHIKDHIEDAEKGFLELMRVLAKKSGQ